jgi:hypothetical protein
MSHWNGLIDTRLGMNELAWTLLHKLSALEPHTAPWIDRTDPLVAANKCDPGYQIECRAHPYHCGREQGFVLSMNRPLGYVPEGGKTATTRIAFFEHRNVDVLCYVVWEDEHSVYTAPRGGYFTWDDHPIDSKYDVSEVANEKEAVQVVLDAIAQYKVDDDATNREEDDEAILHEIFGSSRGGCPSSHLGVPCRRSQGHTGRCRGLERGRSEVWQWTDNPDDELITAPWDTSAFPGDDASLFSEEEV